MHSEKFVDAGLTYDDVLLVPAYSEVLPREVDTTTRFSRNLKLNVPIVSAAMDTVTEHIMALAIAREGGIGVLHKNMSIEEQALQVRKVKRAESGMVIDPITLPVDSTVADALELMKENKIGGIPIVTDSNKLVGIVTNRDLRFERSLNKPLKEVMTKDNLVTAREFTDHEKAADILQAYKIEKLLIVDKDYKLIGLITYKDIIKIKSHPYACKDKHGRLKVAAAVGTSPETMERVEELVKAAVDAIVVDTAHGHSKKVIDTVKLIKSRFPDMDVVAGNIATPEAALALAKVGADGLKVGIGPGSICTTRIIAGVGVPQLSAVLNVAQAVKDLDIPIIADGGARYTGDIVKAIAAGASTVMAGSMFAGVDESPGETIIYEGRKYKVYRGMGSIEAMQKGSKDRYFQTDEHDVNKLVPEGIVGRVPYKGSLTEVMHQLVGGLRAGMGYCGASTIFELQKSKFIKITHAGILESHPHDVTIMRESPNYSR
ncbi:MAG: IMP dehydrogenase [Bacteroidetes bacterium]|nr:IMP dehydrogenase [Bacteroidota bacterium]MBU1720017.1 IMP dehydrogenase [Bacteroidota bacterium]